MKFIKSLYALSAVLLMALFAGCSSRDFMEEASAYLSDDDLVVMALNPWNIYDNLGATIKGDEIVLPDYLERSLRRMTDPGSTVDVILSLEGINPHKMIIAADSESENTFFMAMEITNHKKFGEWMESLQLKSDDKHQGYKVFSKRGVYFMVKDDIVFVTDADSAEDAVDNLDQRHERAKKSPVKAWVLHQLMDDDAMVAVLNYDKVMDIVPGMSGASLKQYMTNFGYTAEQLQYGKLEITFTADDNKLKAYAAMKDAEGNKLQNPILQQKADTGVFSYCGDADMMAGIAYVDSNIDWKGAFDSYLGAMAQMGPLPAGAQEIVDAAVDVLSDVDGTIMFSVGFAPDFNPVVVSNEVALARNLRAILVAQVKPGTAEKYAMMMHEGLNPFADMVTLNTKVDGNVLIAAINDTPDKKDVKNDLASDFKGCNGGFVIQLPAGNDILKSFGIDYGMKLIFKTEGSESEGELELLGTDNNILETLVKLMSRF